MDFRLSDEQFLFRDTARRFVDAEMRPVARNWEQSGRYSAEIVAGLRELGLFGLTVPEQYGGASRFGVDGVGLRGVVPWLDGHRRRDRSLSCSMIARHGTAEQRSRWLPAFISTTALRQGGQDLDHNARHADPLPGQCRLRPKPSHRGMSFLMIPADSPGYIVSRDLLKLGYKGPASCEIILEDVRVPVDHVLGGIEGQGMQQVPSGLEVGRINVAARLVGIAQEACDRAIMYARQREAFGRPIAEFRAIQHKTADMATEVQAAP